MGRRDDRPLFSRRQLPPASPLCLLLLCLFCKSFRCDFCLNFFLSIFFCLSLTFFHPFLDRLQLSILGTPAVFILLPLYFFYSIFFFLPLIFDVRCLRFVFVCYYRLVFRHLRWQIAIYLCSFAVCLPFPYTDPATGM